MKSILIISLLGFLALFAGSAHSQGPGTPPGVVHVILFEYTGDEATLAERFRGAQEIQARINPEVRMSLAYDLYHGAATDRYRISTYYPNLIYFAEVQLRERSSEEWQELVARREAEGTSVRLYEGLSRIVVAGRASE